VQPRIRGRSIRSHLESHGSNGGGPHNAVFVVWESMLPGVFGSSARPEFSWTSTSLDSLSLAQPYNEGSTMVA
jgi:hypothetical protein